MDLLELAGRCEAAVGPDRWLDAEIACATRFPNFRPAEPDDFDGKYGYQPGNLKVPTGFLMADSYTRSLDAAMSLDQTGLLVVMGDIAADGLPGVCLCTDTGTSPPAEHWGICADGRNATREQKLALAFCAAALRARFTAILPRDQTSDDAKNG